MGKTYTVSIVGESHYQGAIELLEEGETVELVHEPDNPYDPRAVAVEDERGECIGYLPRGSWLASALIDQGKDIAASVGKVTGSTSEGEGMLGVVLEVSVGAAADPQARAEAEMEAAGKVLGNCLGQVLFLVAIVAILALALSG